MTGEFEPHRSHLKGVAYRMLGSASDADDAVQETWLRLQRADTSEVENLRGWLTTVVARVALDMLRARKSRHEATVEPAALDATPARTSNPEEDALLADSVSVALLLVLDTLSPAERLAFVLHDLFGVSFDEVAGIVGKSPAAARQLASRARRRVRGETKISREDLTRQQAIVERFLTALRAGDLNGLMDVLDPDLVVRVDGASAAGGVAREVHGAREWATGAVAFARASRAISIAMVNGRPGLVLASRGRLVRALTVTFAHDRITAIEIVGDPDRLREIPVTVPDVASPSGRTSPL